MWHGNFIGVKESVCASLNTKTCQFGVKHQPDVADSDLK